MQAFTKLTAIAAPLPLINIDTDMIIPKQFLRTIKRSGLGKNAFNEMRYDENGNENPDFVLNKDEYRNSEILIAGDNFGCGSSREHAPWALLDFGFKCIISTSFADIFYNNCFKNGILPIILEKDKVDELMGFAEDNKEINIDLDEQMVRCGNVSVEFDIDPFRKHCLINGLDDIGLTLEKKISINRYEEMINKERSWI